MFSGKDNDDVDAWITELNDIRQMDIIPPHQLFIRAKQMLAGKAKFNVKHVTALKNSQDRQGDGTNKIIS